jgi:ElaB/YqjD/DUF883 family membrane-anchored ribosome-binding protein
MVSDFDEVARRLKDKYDQKNNQMKELKARVQEMVKEQSEKYEALEDRARKAERKNNELLES